LEEVKKNYREFEMIEEVISEGFKLVRETLKERNVHKSFLGGLLIVLFLYVGIGLFVILNPWIAGLVSFLILLFLVFVLIPVLFKKKNNLSDSRGSS